MNTSTETLCSVYEQLSTLVSDMISLHKVLEEFYVKKQIPFETLRFSAIQVVNTSSMVTLVKYQSKMLHNMFTTMLNSAMAST